ncbi:hypothetical protein KAR91_84225 [Candidatus Pacearchaeota archaeon]|nr:hypothetical protein [Candidatus Pacearchaeota archaeon]
MGLEYNARALVPPSEDKELQFIIAREKEFRADERVSASTKKVDRHLDLIDRQIDTLTYHREITEDTIYELGLLTLLRAHWLESIEAGPNNPLAKDLLNAYNLLSH